MAAMTKLSRQNDDKKPSPGGGGRQWTSNWRGGRGGRKGAPTRDIAAVAVATGLGKDSPAIIQSKLGYTAGAWVEAEETLVHYAADRVGGPAQVEQALLDRKYPTIAPEPVTATVDTAQRQGEGKAERNARVKSEREIRSALEITEARRAANKIAEIREGCQNCFPYIMTCVTPTAKQRAEHYESAVLSYSRAKAALDSFELLDILATVCGQESRRDREKGARKAAVDYLHTPQDLSRENIDAHLANHQKRRETVWQSGILILTQEARVRYAKKHGLVDVSQADYTVIDETDGKVTLALTAEQRRTKLC